MDKLLQHELVLIGLALNDDSSLGNACPDQIDPQHGHTRSRFAHQDAREATVDDSPHHLSDD